MEDYLCGKMGQNLSCQYGIIFTGTYRRIIRMYDIIIIGGGVSGAAIARELSRYKAEICLVEKEEE